MGRRAVSLLFDFRRLVVTESSPARDALSVIISIILRFVWNHRNDSKGERERIVA